MRVAHTWTQACVRIAGYVHIYACYCRCILSKLDVGFFLHAFYLRSLTAATNYLLFKLYFTLLFISFNFAVCLLFLLFRKLALTMWKSENWKFTRHTLRSVNLHYYSYFCFSFCWHCFFHYCYWLAHRRRR